MIILNGKKFAENEKEFLDSLFCSSGTCIGYAKRNKRTVFLMDHNKERIGAINREGVIATATKVDNGKFWYSYGTPEIIGEYEKYSQEIMEPRSIALARDRNGHLIFK